MSAVVSFLKLADEKDISANGNGVSHRMPQSEGGWYTMVLDLVKNDGGVGSDLDINIQISVDEVKWLRVFRISVDESKTLAHFYVGMAPPGRAGGAGGQIEKGSASPGPSTGESFAFKAPFVRAEWTGASGTPDLDFKVYLCT